MSRTFNRIILILTIHVSLIACSSNNDKIATKELTFIDDTIYVNKATTGKKIFATFVYENTGDSEIKIKKIGTDCDCAIVHFDSTSIKPGNKGEIKVSYQPKDSVENNFRVFVVEATTKQKFHSIYLISK